MKTKLERIGSFLFFPFYLRIYTIQASVDSHIKDDADVRGVGWVICFSILGQVVLFDGNQVQGYVILFFLNYLSLREISEAHFSKPFYILFLPLLSHSNISHVCGLLLFPPRLVQTYFFVFFFYFLFTTLYLVFLYSLIITPFLLEPTLPTFLLRKKTLLFFICDIPNGDSSTTTNAPVLLLFPCFVWFRVVF